MPPVPSVQALSPMLSAHALLQGQAVRTLWVPPDKAVQDHAGVQALYSVPHLQAMPSVQALSHPMLSAPPLLPDLPVGKTAPEGAMPDLLE